MWHHNWAHGVVVSHPLRMRKALGSIPSGSTFLHTCCMGAQSEYVRGLSTAARMLVLHLMQALNPL